LRDVADMKSQQRPEIMCLPITHALSRDQPRKQKLLKITFKLI